MKYYRIPDKCSIAELVFYNDTHTLSSSFNHRSCQRDRASTEMPKKRRDKHFAFVYGKKTFIYFQQLQQ